MPRLSLGLGIQNSRKVGGKSPIPRSGLSLWLKADAGVTKFSYNYASQIVISGTSTPSFSGTYTAIGTPGYTDGVVDSYSFSAPSGRQMNWNSSEVRYELFLSGSGSGGFQSSDGTDWTPLEQYISTITITGFTGIYSGANGTYNATSPNSGIWDRVGGGFFIDGDGLRDNVAEYLIATPPNDYSGSWTATSYDSSVTLTGAGTTSANGTYTRSDTNLDLRTVPFTASGGRSIVFLSSDWFVTNSAQENLYDNDGNLINWNVNSGDSPAPTGSVGTSARSVGSPTSTSVIVPTGSISGSVTLSTVDTNNVLEWQDQSGNGRNAVNNNGFAVYNLLGGKSFLSFDSYVDMLTNSAIWNNLQFVGTIFVVARFASSSSGNTAQLLYQEGVDGSFVFSRGYNNTNAFAVTTDEIDVVSSLTNVDNNTNYILETTFNESLIATLYLNGISNGTGGVTNNTGTVNMLIGGGAESSNIAEIVVYNRVLTTQERQQVEAYLNTKYAIY